MKKGVLEQLKKEVLGTSIMPLTHGFVAFAWGNVSAIDRERSLVVINLPGITYDMVNMYGNIVDGSFKLSSNTLILIS